MRFGATAASEAHDSAVRRVAAFCDEQVDEAKSQLRLEHAVRGNSITSIERRAPWNDDGAPPARDVGALLDENAEDPTGIFRG